MWYVARYLFWQVSKKLKTMQLTWGCHEEIWHIMFFLNVYSLVNKFRKKTHFYNWAVKWLDDLLIFFLT